jgi:glycosyltransferase involved in cell wall biosynthesis
MISVIIPTHNPDANRLARTIAALRLQDLPKSEWELLLIDNASEPPLNRANWELSWHDRAQLIREDSLGLTSARLRGFREAHGELFVLVDDDNVLRPDYLSISGEIAAKHPQLGAFGGALIPEFESVPPAWMNEFIPMLAVRDLGSKEIVMAWNGTYPSCAPLGAGMVIRRKAALEWTEEIASDSRRRVLDRTAASLVSGGDNDMVISAMKRGWQVGYFPALVLNHLIPARRCDAGYLSRLNRAMSESWMRLLTIHDINPWPPIPAWSVPLRQAKAWIRHRAWAGKAGRVRWAGACGHFEGRKR